MATQPIEYQRGFVEFLNCKINLSLRPLIPRAETAFWTKKAIRDMARQKYGKIRTLDIFAGSGCIGVAVLKNTKNSYVDFSEVDKKFLKQIAINCRLNKINPNRYKIIQSDVFSNIIGKYDYILANPPYVALKRKYLIQNSVLEYEPKEALLAGEDGMYFIDKFLKGALPRLKKHGRIYMEFDCLAKKELEDILKKYHYKNYKFYKDQFKRWRYVVIEQI